MVKRTYSTRDKWRSSYEHQSISDPSDSRKRHKVDDSDELHLPTPPPSRGSSVLKKSLRMFNGPTSIPDDESENDTASNSKSGNGLSRLFDKASNGKLRTPKLRPNANIHGSWDEFTETVKNGNQSGQNCAKPNGQLPTPPAEVSKAYQQTGKGTPTKKTNGFVATPSLMSLGTSTTCTATETSRLFEKIIIDAPAKQPYEPKLYQADRTSAPSKTIVGDRLSTRSKEAQMWSANQKESPLLRLPGEIRNLIYEYVLGGNTINIGFQTYRTTYKSDKPREVRPVFKYHCTVYNRQTNPFRMTQPPYINVSTGFVPLNSICRQVYLETDTLPFKLNFVSFNTYNVMFNMLFMEKRLSRRQLDAITKLILPDALPQANMLLLLRNLEKVYLCFDLMGTSKGWYRVIRREGEEPELVQSRAF